MQEKMHRKQSYKGKTYVVLAIQFGNLDLILKNKIKEIKEKVISNSPEKEKRDAEDLNYFSRNENTEVRFQKYF